jgi:molybdenum cofactor cytidylyltransferase
MAAEPRVAALLLAAGRGTRFGNEPKLLAPLDGAPLVRHAARAALASRAAPLLVVLGHAATAVEEALADLAFAAVPNPAYAEGLATSLKAGFAALPSDVEAAVVLLGDMPGVGAALIDRLIAAYAEAGRRSAPPLAVVPVAGGRRGNPVLLDRRLAPEIAGLSGDRGAGPMLAGRDGVLELAVEDPGALLDVDTPDVLAGIAPGFRA